MPVFKGPRETWPELFEAVQLDKVLGDSKTFVDAIPESDVDTVLADFAKIDSSDRSALRQFVSKHFRLPEAPVDASDNAARKDIRDRIEEVWGLLRREPDAVDKRSSLIELPRPYYVPGGRFREVFYWDSYFTMLGLAESGRNDAVEDMVENFAYLIDEVGFIPNGNRSYFCTRSQPPHFVLMVELLAVLRDDPGVVNKYLNQLKKEYDFWMSGVEELSGDRSAVRRVVRMGEALLNRHWDAADTPRPESYAEDCELINGAGLDSKDIYRNLRAACESGWDFSSRWLRDPGSLVSIRTTDILPVDLNALLYRLECVLEGACREQGDMSNAELYASRAGARGRALQTLFFDETAGMFVDVLISEARPTGVLSAASSYPLFLEIATDIQAARVAMSLEQRFLAPGGWLTTLETTSQQWDRPNGWAPLQWVTFKGLYNYGFDDLADTAATRWVENCRTIYRDTGRLLEKYDVEHIGNLATGGEYVVQDGFGWTNAILLKFMNHLDLD